jgi:hypothetical protein
MSPAGTFVAAMTRFGESLAAFIEANKIPHIEANKISHREPGLLGIRKSLRNVASLQQSESGLPVRGLELRSLYPVFRCRALNVCETENGTII